METKFLKIYVIYLKKEKFDEKISLRSHFLLGIRVT